VRASLGGQIAVGGEETGSFWERLQRGIKDGNSPVGEEDTYTDINITVRVSDVVNERKVTTVTVITRDREIVSLRRSQSIRSHRTLRRFIREQ